jgi:hypothetical protein
LGERRKADIDQRHRTSVRKQAVVIISFIIININVSANGAN